MKVSVIIPCYCSEKTIGGVVGETTSALDLYGCESEIILVDDCSPDDTWKTIEKICKKNHKCVKGVSLARNFGQHSAIMAGVKQASGDILIFLDDDGQTPANEIGKLIDALDDSCDVIFAKYDNKRHALWRNIGSKVNDYMAQALIGKPKNLSISSYCACKDFVADELKKYNGTYPYLSGLLLRSAKRIKNVSVNHREREVGHSGYTIGKLVTLWLNGFTAFSVKPLRVATVMGFLIALIGFLYGFYVIIKRLINPLVPMGYSSTMAAMLFLGGAIMVMLGLVGEYVGRIYININNAPQFVIRKKTFEDQD